MRTQTATPEEALVAWYKTLSRREFVKTAAAAAMLAGTACNSNRSPWRFLRVEEARTLAAMCDCIIPPDSDPGAEWAQVVNYIDIQLCGPFRKLRDNYRDGLVSLDRTSQKEFGKDFAALSAADQSGLLAKLEKGAVAKELWPTVSATGFFNMALAHTMQGYYGDPRHGGNRDRVSWKMIGIPYPQVRGRFRSDAGDQKS
jgi:gluconate 2-dehydrogenase gamma chain